MKIKSRKYAARGRLGIQTSINGKKYFSLYFLEIGWYQGLYVGFCLPFLDSFNNSISIVIKSN